jgi:catechol 2,3-dioxygenase-like lactoylglutathione lyase family enzyme
MNVNLEVVTVPVSDVDKALDFYRDQLGWRVDADINRDEFRVVQLTPTGDGHTSIVFGRGIPTAEPGSMRHRSSPPRASPSPTPTAPATRRMHHSATRTATAGRCKWSPTACPAANRPPLLEADYQRPTWLHPAITKKGHSDETLASPARTQA